MTYRDDREALRERVDQLEKKMASAVSPEELAAVREQLAAARARIEAEREALDAMLGRLGTAPRRNRRALAIAAIGLALLLAGAALGVAIARFDEPRAYEGAPNAARWRPVRREIDVEVARLLPDLDGCLPDGDRARIQVEVVFEGRDGSARDITPVNVSEHDSYPIATAECLVGVLQGVGVALFSASSYRYQLTLEWTDAGLQAPALWDRYELARDPRER